jgi:D-alanine transaminase
MFLKTKHDPHLKRLDQSLAAIYMEPPLSHDEWNTIFRELLKRNQPEQAAFTIYLQVTRGVEDTRNPAIPENITPTVLAFCTPTKSKLSLSAPQGFAAITLEDSRRRDCYIKAIGLLPNVLLYHQARKAEAIEAILIRDGEVLEGTSSNVFIVKDHEILTPPLSPKILGGVTRDLIVTIARKHHIPCRETTISPSLLETADEIWITSSSKEIYPIIKLNQKPVGSGKIGPLWYKMIEHYENYKRLEKQSDNSIPL